MSDDRCDLLCLDAPRAESLRERLLDEETAFGAAGRARALSDPTRLTLAAALGEGGELCVCDLAWISGRSRGLVSHHLRTLRSLDLVRSRRLWRTRALGGTGRGHGLRQLRRYR